MSFPHRFLVIEIPVRIVAEIMPYQVVVEILGSDPMEAFHEGFKLAMVAIDMLDAQGTMDAAVGLQLQQADTLMFGKSHVGVVLVGTQHCIRRNSPAEYTADAADGSSSKISNLGNRLAIPVDGTWNAHLLQ